MDRRDATTTEAPAERWPAWPRRPCRTAWARGRVRPTRVGRLTQLEEVMPTDSRRLAPAGCPSRRDAGRNYLRRNDRCASFGRLHPRLAWWNCLLSPETPKDYPRLRVVAIARALRLPHVRKDVCKSKMLQAACQLRIVLGTADVCSLETKSLRSANGHELMEVIVDDPNRSTRP